VQKSARRSCFQTDCTVSSLLASMMPRPVIDLTIDLTKADSPSDSDDPGAMVSWAEPNLHAEKREVGLRPTLFRVEFGLRPNRAMVDRGSSSDSCICQCDVSEEGGEFI